MRFSGPLAWCLVALLASSGCARKRIPPPAPATVVIPSPKPPQPKPVTLPPGPTLNTSRVPESKPPEPQVELPPPPPKPVPKKSRRNARRGPAAPKPEAPKVADTKPVPPSDPKAETDMAKPETEVPKAETPAVSPQLEVILTPEQNRDYSKRIDSALDRARSAVQLIQAKSLNSAQKDTVSRIQSFITQAEQARVQDLVSSLSLAERADLLSKDLLERIGR